MGPFVQRHHPVFFSFVQAASEIGSSQTPEFRHRTSFLPIPGVVPRVFSAILRGVEGHRGESYQHGKLPCNRGPLLTHQTVSVSK